MLLFAGAPALGTGVGDNLALAVALGTGGNIGEAAKDTLLDPAHLSVTVTVGASAGLAIWGTTCALTQGAVLGA